MFRTLIVTGLTVFSAVLWAQQAALLVYEVHEQGAPRYFSRFLITDDLVRIDEGGGEGQPYTLYHRGEQAFYNVNPEERTVLVLTPPEKALSVPADIKLTQTLEPASDAPEVGGRKPQALNLLVNGQPCRQLVVVKGLMSAALAGLKEMRAASARLQYRSVELLDDGILSDCERSEWVYAPQRALQQGLPLSDRMPGKQQVLVDYQPSFDVDDKLFEVPADYRRITPSPLF